MSPPFESMPAMAAMAMLFGSISAYTAKRKGKNPYLWFAMGFLFGLLGVFALFFAIPSAKARPVAKKEMVKKLSGPAGPFWYYLAQGQKQMGPFSKREIETLHNEKKIFDQSLVWHEELGEEWKPLGSLYEEKPL